MRELFAQPTVPASCRAHIVRRAADEGTDAGCPVAAPPEIHLDRQIGSWAVPGRVGRRQPGVPDRGEHLPLEIRRRIGLPQELIEPAPPGFRIVPVRHHPCCPEAQKQWQHRTAVETPVLDLVGVAQQTVVAGGDAAVRGSGILFAGRRIDVQEAEGRPGEGPDHRLLGQPVDQSEPALGRLPHKNAPAVAFAEYLDRDLLLPGPEQLPDGPAQRVRQREESRLRGRPPVAGADQREVPAVADEGNDAQPCPAFAGGCFLRFAPRSQSGGGVDRETAALSRLAPSAVPVLPGKPRLNFCLGHPVARRRLVAGVGLLRVGRIPRHVAIRPKRRRSSAVIRNSRR